MVAVRATGIFPRCPDSTTLTRAVFASIALHGLILILIPALLDAQKPRRLVPGPLVARLTQARPAVAPSAAPAEMPKPRAEEVQRPVRRLLLSPDAQPVLNAPLLAIVPPAPSPAQPAVEPVPSAPAPTPTVLTPRLETVSLPPVPPTPQQAVDTADPATLGQYRIAIISAARRYKKYPRIAMDNNWEGRVEVRMRIDVSGTIASIGIRSGSGFEILDQQALDMIRKAKPLAPIPAALRGKAFTLDVPVLFSLKEETG